MNKKQLMGLFTAFLLCFAQAIFAQTVDEFTDLKKPIIVKSAQPIFSIKLKSNPTTGYSWFIKDYNHQQLDLIDHAYIAGDSKLVGASGYEIWHFKVKPSMFIAPQLFNIQLLYARPWELSTAISPLTVTIVSVSESK